MGEEDIPRDVRRFIFEKVNSVELLEVLFLLRLNESKSWCAQAASDELRANPTSISQRFAYLQKLDLVEADPTDPEQFHYAPKTPEARKLIDQLADAYRVRRTTVLEMIFSPMKKAIDLASAFDITKGK